MSDFEISEWKKCREEQSQVPPRMWSGSPSPYPTSVYSRHPRRLYSWAFEVTVILLSSTQATIEQIITIMDIRRNWQCFCLFQDCLLHDGLTDAYNDIHMVSKHVFHQMATAFMVQIVGSLGDRVECVGGWQLLNRIPGGLPVHLFRHLGCII